MQNIRNRRSSSTSRPAMDKTSFNYYTDQLNSHARNE